MYTVQYNGGGVWLCFFGISYITLGCHKNEKRGYSHWVKSGLDGLRLRVQFVVL